MSDMLGSLLLIPKSIVMSWRRVVPMTTCSSRLGHAMALAVSGCLLYVGGAGLGFMLDNVSLGCAFLRVSCFSFCCAAP
jgi:hypothetical protein